MSSESVITICGNLGVKTISNKDKRLPNTLQAHLVKWIISVYSFLEEQDIIERLYGILFNYLEFEFLRPSIAHLLFLATKKKHVNPSRIERLRQLYSKYDESEHLVGLLILYKEHAPEEIFDTFPRISHTIFAHPNYTYLNELIALNSKGDRRSLQITNEELNYMDVFSQKLKKRKKNLATSDLIVSMTLSQNESIHSISDLSEKLEKLNIPSSPEAILADKSEFSMYILLLKGDSVHFDKFEAWIIFLLEEFEDLSGTEKLDLLQSLKRYVELSGELSHSIAEKLVSNEKILSDKSPGVQSCMWSILKYLNPLSEDKLQVILKPLLQKIESQSIEWLLSLLELMGFLVNSWPSKLTFLKEERDELLTLEELYKIILMIFSQITSLLPDILIKSKYERRLVLQSLSFISLIENIPPSYLKIEDVVMSPPLTYIYYFVNDPLAISLLCGRLNFAKVILQEAISNENTIKLTALHNSYVVDICNSIWRNKAFDTSKKADGTSFGLDFEFINSLMIRVPIFDRNSSFSLLFNINHSPSFASRSANIVRLLEDMDSECSTRHAGPLTQSSVKELLHDPESKWLKTDYETTRVDILRILDKAGYVGLADLLFSHLKSLLNKR